MPSIPLAKARTLAEKVCTALAPYTAAVEIAGSIRRQRPAPQDIDIVVLPYPGADGTARLNEGARKLYERGPDSSLTEGRLITNGPQSKRLLLRGSLFQCDLWVADHGKPAGGDLFAPVPASPSNWGALLLTYTGSKEHNMHVVATAKARGWQWHPTRGLLIFGDGPHRPCTEVVSADERGIFLRLFGHFIAPEAREA